MILFIISWLVIGLIFGTLTVKLLNPSEHSNKALLLYAIAGYACLIVFIVFGVFYLSMWFLDGKKP